MDVYTAMRSIPTTRTYQADPVPHDVMYRVLDHARFAASGGNRQGWKVVLIEDRSAKVAIRDVYLRPFNELMQRVRAGGVEYRTGHRKRGMESAEAFAQGLADVPMLLVLAVDIAALELTDAALQRPSIVGGASIYNFMQNVILGCRNEGLATAVTTLLSAEEPQAKELLGLPDAYAAAAMLAVGYPDPPGFDKKLTRRPVEEFCTIDHFGGEALLPPSGGVAGAAVTSAS